MDSLCLHSMCFDIFNLHNTLFVSCLVVYPDYGVEDRTFRRCSLQSEVRSAKLKKEMVLWEKLKSDSYETPHPSRGRSDCHLQKGKSNAGDKPSSGIEAPMNEFHILIYLK